LKDIESKEDIISGIVDAGIVTPGDGEVMISGEGEIQDPEIAPFSNS
tara:strand:+ start:70 stop:210 length:141 start_codon:yes stop_codon:yes gene_type:complete